MLQQTSRIELLKNQKLYKDIPQNWNENLKTVPKQTKRLSYQCFSNKREIFQDGQRRKHVQINISVSEKHCVLS